MEGLKELVHQSFNPMEVVTSFRILSKYQELGTFFGRMEIDPIWGGLQREDIQTPGSRTHHSMEGDVLELTNTFIWISSQGLKVQIGVTSLSEQVVVSFLVGSMSQLTASNLRDVLEPQAIPERNDFYPPIFCSKELLDLFSHRKGNEVSQDPGGISRFPHSPSGFLLEEFQGFQNDIHGLTGTNSQQVENFQLWKDRVGGVQKRGKYQNILDVVVNHQKVPQEKINGDCQVGDKSNGGLKACGKNGGLKPYGSENTRAHSGREA